MIRYRRHAAIIAGTYLVVGLAYILVSSGIAAQMSATLGNFKRLEEVKGSIFILLTSIGLYYFASWQLRQVTRDAAELLKHRDLLMASERRALSGVLVSALAREVRRDLNAAGTVVEQTPSLRKLGELSERLRARGAELASGDQTEIDLRGLVRSSIEIARNYPQVRGCDIRLMESEPLRVRAYAGLIHQSIVNLLINAGEATGGKGKVQVILRDDPDRILLEVHDNGPAVPAEQWHEVFEPFSTTKARGLGLGLVTVSACASIHQGSVEVVNSPLGGACFELCLPKSMKVS